MKYFTIVVISLMLLTLMQCKQDANYYTNTNALAVSSPLNIEKYKNRRFDHVTEFYQRISDKTIKICMEHNIPPAALLAIAGLESGFGQGYVGKITGNILSLGAGKNEKALPALQVYVLKKTGEVLLDSTDLFLYAPNEYKKESRRKSWKKDYRPEPWKGTKEHLNYFTNNPEEKHKAHVKNIEDFAKIFISENNRFQPFRDARKLMEELVRNKGKETLLEESTINQFIDAIGGKKNSFNHRKSWPRKVKNIMRNTGLVPLVKDMYKGKNFEECW